MLYMLFRDYGWEAIAAAPPLDPSPTPFLNYLLAVELGIASGISWWGGVGFLARNTRTRRNAIYPEILQLGLATGVACSIGLFSALVVQSEDPTEWMVPIGGVFMGVLALIFVALANVTSTAVSLFASGLALRHIPFFSGRAWWQLMVVLVIPCMPFVFWPAELYDLGDAFLAYNGTMYAPISGILFVDYFWLRGQQISLWAVFEDSARGAYYYARGFNWIALGSLVLGQATYLYLYNPITGETHESFRWIPASIAAFIVPALVYGIGMRLRAGTDASVEPSPAGQGRLIEPNI
jgi:NCS1 family nucleobase:cation symporter-1